MNHHQTRRYIFVDYESLKKIKFKKLEKVCDKLFVFIDANEAQIPFVLVRQMQRMGSSVKWVTVDNLNQSGANYHISFLMGKLHEKVNYDIEFAVLSNDLDFDHLINFINSEGRSCVRVKRKDNAQQEEYFVAPNNNAPVNVTPTPVVSPMPQSERQSEHIESSINSDFQPQPFGAEREMGDELVEQTAQETINRLIRSGNRPAEISTLKNYILLHNQELSFHGNLEKIIRRMEEKQEIHIQGQEVVYNF
jgi:hypothetical protein